MNDERRLDERVHRSSFLVPRSAFITVLLLFLAARIALLFIRQPFFDELFTVWMARQPLPDVVPNLRNDSGPPLYYWMARFDSVRALRWLSLAFAAVQFGLIAICAGDVHRRDPEDAQSASAQRLRLRGESPVALLAASLLAVYPPAILSSVDSRAYALCALFVTAGVLALAANRRFAAAGAFVLGAYSHYYGVLFFPVLLTGVGQPLPSLRGRKSPDRSARAALDQRVLPFAAACAAFIPGFFLALHQPSQALGWNREPFYAPLMNVSWIGTYPESLFAPAPVGAAMVATLLLTIAVSRSWRFAPAVLIPLALVLVFHLAGRPVYFPMRFESVIAGPLALWVASSLTAPPRRSSGAPSAAGETGSGDVPDEGNGGTLRRSAGLLAAVLMTLGATSVAMALTSHARRPADPYRHAALVLRDHATLEAPVVATGFCYLESVVALRRPIAAWPAEQAIHPGWRARAAGDVRDLPPGVFLWIGERQSPELARLQAARALRPLFVNERAVIVRVEGLTAPLH